LVKNNSTFTLLIPFSKIPEGAYGESMHGCTLLRDVGRGVSRGSGNPPVKLDFEVCNRNPIHYLVWQQ